MGARGSCSVCFDRRRAEIDAARAEGMPVATIARTFNIATTTAGRHFRHARPRPRSTAAPAPAPAPVSVEEPSVSFARVKAAAQYLGVPLSRFAACVEDHVGYSITTSSETELDELHAAWAATDDDAEYIGTIVRNGKFHEETARAVAECR